MMRSIVQWSLAGACFLFSAMQAMAQFSVNLPYKQVTVQNVNGTAAFNGAMINGDVGKPAMPSYLVSFLLPPDVDFKDVTVSIVNPVDREIAGSWSVNPIKPQYDKNDQPMWPKGLTLVDGKDMKIYNKNAFSPAAYQGNVAFGKMRQYKVVDIIVNPFQWNPVTGKLHTLTSGTLVVTVPNSVLSTSASVRDIPRCFWAERLLAGKVVNFSEAQYYGASPAQSSPSQTQPAQMSAAAGAMTGNYAIITTNKILNSSKTGSDMISKYIQILYQQACPTVIVVTEGSLETPTNWVAGTTADACANNIRKWLYDNYEPQNQNIQYVLLIGNPDATAPNTAMPDVPMKMEPYNNPTDYFYTDLSDPNDISDNMGEVRLGRIPVYPDGSGNPNMTDLDKILLKTIKYKTSPDIEWREFAMLPVSPAMTGDDYTFGEEIVTNAMIPMGWQYRRLYEPYFKVSFSLTPDIVNMNPLPEVPFCNKTLVINNWTAFNPGLVAWYSHGHQNDVDSILNTTTVTYLKDDYPAIVVATSCFTMYPEDPNNIGYLTLLYNAAAYIGGTRPLDADAGFHQGPQITCNLVDSLMTVGDALNSMRSQWSVKIPTSYDDHINVLLYNIYGCPEVAIGVSHYGMPLPQNVTVQAVSNNQINLSWTGVSGANFYVIERWDAKMSGFEGIGSAPGYATSFQDVGLSIGTKYKYRMYATGYGPRSGYTPIDSATTWDANNQSLLPGIPQRLTGQPYCNSADLYWVAPSSGTAPESYNIKRSSNRLGPFVTVACTTAASTYYRCPNLLNGTPYFFKVTAVNSYGQSAEQSTPLSVTPAVQPINAAPSALKMDDPSTGPSMLSPKWTDNSDDELWFNLKYSYNRNIAGDIVPFSKTVQLARNQTQTNIFELENNTQVSFSLQAGNDSYTTDFSSCMGTGTTTGSTSDGGPPAVPTNFKATSPDPITINLSWTPPTSGPKPDSFQIWSKIIPPTGTAPLFSLCDEVPGTSNNYKLTIPAPNPPTQGTKMAFTIRSVYYQKAWICLRSSCVNAQTITTPVYACSAPSNCFAQILSNTSVLLTWKDNSGGLNPVFLIERDNGDGKFNQIGQTNPGATSFTDNYIFTQGATYDYRIRAYLSSKSYKYSPYSDQITTRIAKPNVPSIYVSAASSSQINLSWDFLDNEDAYKVQRSIGNSNNWTVTYSFGHDVTTYTDNSGISPNTTYAYRVQASNKLGTSNWSSVMYVTTLAAPTGLAATVVSRSQINLSWNYTHSKEDGFTVERVSPGSSSFFYIGGVGNNTKTYQDKQLTPGTAYQYRVCAYNNSGQSSYSNTAPATTYSGSSLAQGKTASASTTQSGSPASNGNDGNSGSRWCASSISVPQWWKVDLGASKTVGEVEIMFEKTGSKGNYYLFTIETSPDNNAWTTRVDMSNNTNTAQTQAYTFTPVTARYVRITIKKAPGTAWASLFEFRVFGK